MDRRPLHSREAGWARGLSRWLASTSVTPNQISFASMGFAAISGAAFWGVSHSDGFGRAMLLLLAALGCQLRLVCNLMDGLVAIEAGKQAKDGPFWNEFPDRIADIFIIVGLGMAVGLPAVGWAAAALAVLTAYTRELGRTCGLAADYSGPMAKPHRMALVTAAAVLSFIDPLWAGQGGVLMAALWVLVLGTAATVVRRGARIVMQLQARG